MKYLTDKTIRVRCRKDYPEAHTHILVGKAIAENSEYIVLRGRAFHFRRLTDRMISQIRRSAEETRIVPWHSIEIIQQLSDKTDWDAPIAFDEDGNLILRDKHKIVLAVQHENID